ncbi:MAG: hypothetical protein KBA81_02715 [Rhabdochlamydiaceae bacterium]|nr:hypothetical protein [Rhabdochlamydiaceae bacterium]
MKHDAGYQGSAILYRLPMLKKPSMRPTKTLLSQRHGLKTVLEKPSTLQRYSEKQSIFLHPFRCESSDYFERPRPPSVELLIS